jgi:hypothetical protein
VSFNSFVTLGTNKVLSLAVFDQIEPINSNWGVSFHSILVIITQLEIRFKTKVSHKHMVVIYHRNTPLAKVRKGLRSLQSSNSRNNSRRKWLLYPSFYTTNQLSTYPPTSFNFILSFQDLIFWYKIWILHVLIYRDRVSSKSFRDLSIVASITWQQACSATARLIGKHTHWPSRCMVGPVVVGSMHIVFVAAAGGASKNPWCQCLA